jgi:murein DD-endopeptidase MepM/ murein hydrolase activator NlpD
MSCDTVSVPQRFYRGDSIFSRTLVPSGLVREGMFARRYTVLIADRSTGVLRRVTVNLRSALAGVTTVLMVPVLIGMGAKWSARAEIEQLRATNAALEIENGNYRATTGALTSQIQALGSVIDDLGERSTLDPEHLRAMQKLPAIVKASAAGGSSVSQPANAISQILSSSLVSPEDTFGVLRNLLSGLESRLRNVRQDGWLTGSFGRRADPFTGERAFHPGLDISTEQGQPVFATADGTVASAARSGEYGNLVVLQHQFGLSTRYGHLSKFNVKAGDTVKRGDVVGFVGATGRATGSHLHYEILANGRLVNPLSLLTQPARR